MHKRLVALLGDRSRSIVFLPNVHHGPIARTRLLGNGGGTARRPAESPNDHNDRLIRAAASWLAGQVFNVT